MITFCIHVNYSCLHQFVWARRYLVGQRIMLYAWIAFLVYLSLMVYFKLHVWMWVM